jgi:hypothetical protein
MLQNVSKHVNTRLMTKKQLPFLAGQPTHPASLPVRVPMIAPLLSALSRPTRSVALQAVDDEVKPAIVQASARKRSR